MRLNWSKKKRFLPSDSFWTFRENQVKFLVDVGVGTKVEDWLSANGYDTRSVRAINARAKDRDILALAVAEARMVITMDKDFGELVHNSGQAHSGVLILRLEDATGDEKAEIVRKILAEHSGQMHHAFCVFQDGKLRIRD